MFQRILVLALASSLMLVAACGEKKDDVENTLSKAEDAVSQVAESAGELKSSIANLSQDKIEDLAAIAAKLESAPAEAKKLLEEHDWSMEEFEKMVDQVKSNEAASKIFEAAKAKFANAH